MLNGVDISSYQNRVDYNSYDFVLIKASEGNNWKDPGLDRHLTGLLERPTPHHRILKIMDFTIMQGQNSGTAQSKKRKVSCLLFLGKLGTV